VLMDDWKLRSIAEIAPTLEALKKLSHERQAILLLRRLATCYGTTSFGKMNFDLPAYAADLNYGFPAIEAGRSTQSIWTCLIGISECIDNRVSDSVTLVLTIQGLEPATAAVTEPMEPVTY
jgi:hypothetical protein